ncbi:hypothetical protein TNIN_484571 [Trichonephila inaurata madagascariensis]|uniref:Uncharacterized protein n=1 Tax=Trichonephila inaurata madagascariensis TaxID=2747483 RepID=A0A8X7CPU4_9ARAC|nr:hypothetical protein TNIN_459921 [Trichonephila inaurata madagascariensis]GFY71812.1 hypothetical protein TNIN_484571 [Trichonephila inaurata madagascariensis]
MIVKKDPEEERLRVVEAATAIIREDIRSPVVENKSYPPPMMKAEGIVKKAVPLPRKKFGKEPSLSITEPPRCSDRQLSILLERPSATLLLEKAIKDSAASLIERVNPAATSSTTRYCKPPFQLI